MALFAPLSGWVAAVFHERREKLAVSRLRGGALRVELPRFWMWSNVVFDCEGGKNDLESTGTDSDAPTAGRPGEAFVDDRPIEATVFRQGDVEEVPVGPGSHARDKGLLVQDVSARTGWALMGDPSVKPGQGSMVGSEANGTR